MNKARAAKAKKDEQEEKNNEEIRRKNEPIYKVRRAAFLENIRESITIVIPTLIWRANEIDYKFSETIKWELICLNRFFNYFNLPKYMNFTTIKEFDTVRRKYRLFWEKILAQSNSDEAIERKMIMFEVGTAREALRLTETLMLSELKEETKRLRRIERMEKRRAEKQTSE